MGVFNNFKQWLAGKEDFDEPMEALVNDPMNPEFDSLTSYLNYSAYDEKTQLFSLRTDEHERELGVGFVIELNPYLGANDELIEKLAPLFMLLPDYTAIQIQIFANPDVRDYLNEYERIQSLRPDSDPMRPVFKSLANKRVEYWRGGTNKVLVPNTAIRLRHFRCIFSVNMHKTSFTDPGSIEKASNLIGRIKSQLQSLQMFNRVWNAEDMLEWTTMMLNPQRMFVNLDEEVPVKWDETQFLSEQIVENRTSLKVLDSGTGLRFGERKNNDAVIAQCYSVSRYPEEFHLSGMGALIGDAIEANLNYTTPFLISMNMFKPNYDEKHNTINLKNARAVQVAESPMAKLLPDAMKIKRDYDVCLAAFGKGGGGVVDVMHQVVIWGKPDEIMLGDSQAVSIWQNAGFGLYKDQYLQLPAYLSSLPMALDKDMLSFFKSRRRWTTKTMSNAICMSPIIGEWSGLGPPVIGMFGTRGQAMSLDLFSNPAGNYNFAVIGASGSGKSFFVNEIVRNYLGLGAQIWLIDVGRSYEKFCRMVGGQYIEFTYEQNLCFPPFQMITDINEDIELLKLIFVLMASPKDALTEQQEAKLGHIILQVWHEKGATGTVDDVMHLCHQSIITGSEGEADGHHAGERDYAMIAVGDQLRSYSSTGIYGRYFNGVLNVEFTNDFIVLELEELKTKPDLQQIIMQMIIYQIMHGMYLSRSNYKIMMIDEAWALLGGSEATARFIEEGYRRVRKYKGACGTATQGINDYYKTPATEAALENADWVFHLRSGSKSLKALEEKKPFDIDEGVLRRIGALRRTDHYSEVYVHTPVGSGVGRLLSDPFNALASSSKAEDFEDVNRYRGRGLDTAEAIEAVLLQRNDGYSEEGAVAQMLSLRAEHKEQEMIKEMS